MKRRLIPPTIATVVLVLAILPVLTDRIPETGADKWTLLLTIAVFVFLSILFGWMRLRMTRDKPPVTVFGRALVDFFSALTLVWLAFGVVSAVSYWFAVQGKVPAPLTIRTINRAAIAFAGALVASTGIAVAYEMQRAGPVLHVHEEPPPPGVDADGWDGGERRSGRDRRREAELARQQQVSAAVQQAVKSERFKAGVVFAVALLLLLAILVQTYGGSSATGGPTGQRDVDCQQFSFQEEAQEYFIAHGGPKDDPNGLDANHDGVACQSLPMRPKATP